MNSRRKHSNKLELIHFLFALNNRANEEIPESIQWKKKIFDYGCHHANYLYQSSKDTVL